jgi:hypothetical protein
VGEPFREKGRSVELHQVFLDHAPHEVGDVHLVDPVPEAPLEAVPVQQRQEKLEVLLLPVVGGGREQQEVPRQAREELAQLVALRVADLTPEEGGGHLVCLVHHHQVPPALRRTQLGLHRLVPRGLVQPHDHQVVFEEPVPRPRCLQLVVGHDLEGKLEAQVQLVLPLLHQVSRADHQAPLHVAPDQQLLDEQARHDGLARPGVVRQQKPQGLPGQHRLVHARDLVRQRFEERGVDRQQGVEEVGQADPVGLGNQAEQGPVSVKAPGASGLDNLKARLVVPVQEDVAHAAGGVLVRELQGVRAEPLDAHHRDGRVGEHTPDHRVRSEVVQLGQTLPSPRDFLAIIPGQAFDIDVPRDPTPPTPSLRPGASPARGRSWGPRGRPCGGGGRTRPGG